MSISLHLSTRDHSMVHCTVPVRTNVAERCSPDRCCGQTERAVESSIRLTWGHRSDVMLPGERGQLLRRIVSLSLSLSLSLSRFSGTFSGVIKLS